MLKNLLNPTFLIPVMLLASGAFNFIAGQYTKRKHQNEINEIKMECEYSKSVSDQLAKTHEGRIDDLSVRLAAARRVYSKPQCVMPPTAKPSTGGYEAAPSGYAPIDAGWLVEYAGTAEGHRQQLIGCQEYIRAVQNYYPPERE